jgi:MFS family permease
LQHLLPDGRLLLAQRALRMFAYGFLSVILVLYLAQLNLTDTQIGILLSGTLAGDAVLSLWITLIADRVGRRRMLLIGAALMIFAGSVLALTDSLILIAIAAVIGTLSPTGNEVGAFLALEQAALPQTTDNTHRTSVFAWYNLIGSFATALGALIAGSLASLLQAQGSTPLISYRVIVAGYALLGSALLLLVTRLSAQVEAARRAETLESRYGLHRSRGVVARLTGLFMIDAFAGGLVVQSIVAYWFHVRFGVDAAVLGGIFFGANIFSGLSALAAGRIAARFGLINTMVWTHIPSNLLLMLVPFMPTLPLAVIVLLARFSISQMDVPTRQSYIMAVVDPDERSAAAGITSIARTAASAIAPTLAGTLLGAGLFSAPFVIAGSLKLVYDFSLYRSFRAVKPPEERG